MASRRLFRLFYRLGFTPWDGHPLAQSLCTLVEGETALAAATALDLGCGTGDNSIYLAKHGWRVTGVDFVTRALERARAKARAEDLAIDFVQADVTALSSAGVGGDFALIIDSGCLHGMALEARDGYAREVTAVAAPGARLLITAFIPGTMLGVPGIDPAEMEPRFTAGWTLQASGHEPTLDRDGNNRGCYYLLQRRH